MKKIVVLFICFSMLLMNVLPIYAEETKAMSLSENFEFGGFTYNLKASYLSTDSNVTLFVTNLDSNEVESCIVNKKNSTVTIDGEVYKVKRSEYVDMNKITADEFSYNSRSFYQTSSNYSSRYISTVSFDLDDFINGVNKAAVYLAGACAVVAFFAFGGPTVVAFATSIKSVATGLGYAVGSNAIVDLTDVRLSSDQYRTTEKHFVGMGNPVYLYKWANRKVKARLTFFSNKTDWMILEYGDSSWWSATRPY